MGLEVALGPAILPNWTDADWDNYWSKHEFEVQKLGNWSATSETIETIRQNLENSEYGSKYPKFMGLINSGFLGWNYSEIPQLLTEIADIKDGLTKLPVTRQVRIEVHIQNNSVSMSFYDGQFLNGLLEHFKSIYPNWPLENLYDLNHHFLDTLENAAKRGLRANKGLVIV